MVFRIRLGRLFGVIPGVEVMRLGKMRMMGGVCMLALLVMLGGVTVMLGRLLVMVGGLGVMFGGAFGVGHDRSPCRVSGWVQADYARMG